MANKKTKEPVIKHVERAKKPVGTLERKTGPGVYPAQFDFQGPDRRYKLQAPTKMSLCREIFSLHNTNVTACAGAVIGLSIIGVGMPKKQLSHFKYNVASFGIDFFDELCDRGWSIVEIERVATELLEQVATKLTEGFISREDVKEAEDFLEETQD